MSLCNSADDQLATSESITDELALHTIKNASTGNQNCTESGAKENFAPPANPPSHGKVVDMCTNIHCYFESIHISHMLMPFIT